MAESASSFMRDWISENIHNDPTWGDRIGERTAAEIVKLKADGRTAGLDLSDPELDDDLLHDEVWAAIENVYDPEVGGIKD